MINNSSSHLLFIEPASAPTAPIVDVITRKMAGAWRDRQTGTARYRGWHDCTGKGCRAHSDNGDHAVGGLQTHSLCVHYVACHRVDVPVSDLERIAQMAHEVKPTPEELMGLPQDRRSSSRIPRSDTATIPQPEPASASETMTIGTGDAKGMPTGLAEELAAMAPADRAVAERIADLPLVEPAPGYVDRAVERARREGVLPPTS